MSSNPRPNQQLRQAALVLAGFLQLQSSACGDDAGSSGPSDAGTHDAAHGGGGRKANGGSGGAGGKAAGGTGGATSNDDMQEVTIHFKAVVADRDFSCLDRYENMGSAHTTVVPADFRFYVQDLKLIDADDKEIPVALDTRAPWQNKDVALIDFEDLQGHCHGTAEINTTITGRVPRQEAGWKGVVFSNGVPESLNHLEQSTLSPPLDQTDLYWAWLNGFRFVVAELAQDAAGGGDAGDPLPGIGLMHIGSSACSKSAGCAKKNRNSIRLTKFDPEKDLIVADLGAIFTDTDLTQDRQCHAGDEFCAPMFKHMGVSFDSGDSLDEQQVYRVEQGSK